VKTIVVKVEDYDQFWAWSRKIAGMADRGEPLPECHGIAFGDPEDMFTFLASPLLALLYAIQNHPSRISALADYLQQDFEQVEHNVIRLLNYGLVKMHDKEVRAISQQIKLEVMLAPSASTTDSALSLL